MVDLRIPKLRSSICVDAALLAEIHPQMRSPLRTVEVSQRAQRKPMCVVEESSVCADRAAGR